MSFQDMTLARFDEVLASSEPTPGGGCASALAGSRAAALAAMVARTTAKSKKFADRVAEMQGIVEEAERLRETLLALVDEDAKAFDGVMAAFRMPKGTPEEQAARGQAIQQAYKAAVGPPMQVCDRALQVLELARSVAERGTPSAASDAGVGALLASTALEGAALNVWINLGSITDESFRAGTGERVRAAQARGQALRDQALEIVRKSVQ